MCQRVPPRVVFLGFSTKAVVTHFAVATWIITERLFYRRKLLKKKTTKRPKQIYFHGLVDL